jgi:chromosome segregation ATPase
VVGKVIPNVGETGVKSIRLGGMTIDDLPIGESARAKEQLPKVEEDERQQQIEDVKARYPTQSVDYIRSRVREARQNISKFQEQRNRIGRDREEYNILLHDAKERDKRIAEVESQLSGDEAEEEIKKLNDQYGLWNTEKLGKQIEQFGESIDRFDAAVKQEQESIDELTELLGQCRARDKELARLGA